VSALVVAAVPMSQAGVAMVGALVLAALAGLLIPAARQPRAAAGEPGRAELAVEQP